MTPADELTVHQLLGRIAYFHTLFIEPALTLAAPRPDGRPCCNHHAPPATARPRAGGLLAGTAWAVLDEIAATFGESTARCPSHGPDCCATCRVASAAADIAETWLATEHRAYRRPAPPERTRRACRRAAADRLGRIFALQHRAPCPTQTAPPAEPRPLPGPTEAPLTGELLALWHDPLAGSASPVVSWLNHCAGIGDIHRVLEARRPTP